MKETLRLLRPELTEKQLDQFNAYYALLVDWNTRMNLTTITEKDEVAKKHFVDSLAALPYLAQGAHVADVGTGAGFPGLPLLIVRPDLKMTLIDSLNKRVTFLQNVCETLGLNATCLHMRAEDAGRDSRYRGTFDVALTRAVSALSVLAELTVPLVKVGGISIAYKGEVNEELGSAENALGLLHAKAKKIDVPSDYGVRSLIILEKTAPTAKTYPRKAGTPAKKPL